MCNKQGVFQLKWITHGQEFCLQKVLLDFGAQPMTLGQFTLMGLGMVDEDLDPYPAISIPNINGYIWKNWWVYQYWHFGAIEPKPSNKLVIHWGLSCGDKCHIIWCFGWGHCVVSYRICIGLFWRKLFLIDLGGNQSELLVQYFAWGVGSNGVTMLARFVNTLLGVRTIKGKLGCKWCPNSIRRHDRRPSIPFALPTCDLPLVWGILDQLEKVIDWCVLQT